MIRLTSKIPDFNVLSPSWVKIKCLYESYKNDDKVMFWVGDDDSCVIALTDGNMMIYNISADLEELAAFVDVRASILDIVVCKCSSTRFMPGVVSLRLGIGAPGIMEKGLSTSSLSN